MSSSMILARCDKITAELAAETDSEAIEILQSLLKNYTTLLLQRKELLTK